MMNELQNTDMRTPIEVALDIDSEGMTTARKLYAFLELAPQNYARWCKSNITENEFAEENVDYWAFFIDEERDFNPNPTKDYKLTAHFAKKLSMKGNSEKSEQAREYFTRLEEKVKQKAIDLSQLSPELQMFNKIFQSVAQQQLEQKRQAEEINKQGKQIEEIKHNQETISDVLTKTSDDEEFRAWCKRQISKIVNLGKFDKGLETKDKYKYAWEESFERLTQKRPCNLKQRVSNEKGRALTNGKPKSWIDKNINTLSVICDDKNLRPAYESVLREMIIYYCVKIA